jgi:peptide/nickel transport system substrate-binding protein
VSRRKWAALIAPVAAAAMLLSACGGSSDGGGDKGVQGGAGKGAGNQDINAMDVSKLKDGGEFKWPLDSLPDNWNYNELDGTVDDGVRILYSIMPHLWLADAGNNVQMNPNYLQSAEITSPDPEVITYKINPQAKWSTGRAISWEDFDATFKALNGTNDKYTVSATTGYEDIEKVEKGANDQEVKVTFKKKFAEWKALFDPLYPKELNSDPDTFNSGWVDGPKITAGPFKIGTIDKTGQLVTVVRDPAWWGPKPKLDKITFRVVDRSALADALANGSIDWYKIGSSVDNYQRAKTTKGAVIRQAPGNQYNHITFNGAPGSILADPKLRVALMKGLDQVKFVKGILGPIVQNPTPLGNHFFLQGTAAYQDNASAVKYDQAAAKADLDALGWKMDGSFRKKDGKQLNIRFVSTAGNPISEQIVKLTQAQLKEIGVNVVVDAEPVDKFFKDFVNTGNFDMTGFGWSSNPFPIGGSKAIYYLDPKSTGQNYGHVGSPELNQKLDEASAELDDAKRTADLQEIDKMVWQEGHHLPLYQVPGAVAIRSTVANFGARGFADVDYTKIGFVA